MSKFQQVIKIYQTLDRVTYKLKNTSDVADGFAIVWNDKPVGVTYSLSIKRSFTLDYGLRVYDILRKFGEQDSVYINTRY